MRKNWKIRILALSLFAGLGATLGIERSAEALQCCSACGTNYNLCVAQCGSNNACKAQCEQKWLVACEGRCNQSC